MGKTRLAIIALFTTILFVSAIAGTIFYYNRVVNDKNSQIASQNNEIINLNNQILNLKGKVANLTGQVTNLTTANLVTALTITENKDGNYNFFS